MTTVVQESKGWLIQFYPVHKMPGGVLLGILVAGVPPGSPKAWPDFRPEIVIFHTRFQTRPLKSIPVSDLAIREKLSSLLRLERKQKSSSNPFRIRIFFFLSYSFGIETIKTFIQSCSSLKNRTRFQTKIGKAYTRFQTKSAQKPFPMVRIREYSTPPGIKCRSYYFYSYCRKLETWKLSHSPIII